MRAINLIKVAAAVAITVGCVLLFSRLNSDAALTEDVPSKARKAVSRVAEAPRKLDSERVRGETRVKPRVGPETDPEIVKLTELRDSAMVKARALIGDKTTLLWERLEGGGGDSSAMTQALGDLGTYNLLSDKQFAGMLASFPQLEFKDGRMSLAAYDLLKLGGMAYARDLDLDGISSVEGFQEAATVIADRIEQQVAEISARRGLDEHLDDAFYEGITWEALSRMAGSLAQELTAQKKTAYN